MKIKKLFAAILAATMVMGMTVSTYATATDDQGGVTPPATETAKYVSDITINGLAEPHTAEGKTIINAYAAVTLDANANAWEVASWATNVITLSADGKSYVIPDLEALTNALPTTPENNPDPDLTIETRETSETFENVPVGAYVITASATDNSATYTTMVANTYDNSQTYMAAKNAVLDAKVGSYVLDKKAELGDDFVGRGEEVQFTITTTFPGFDPEAVEKTFTVTDTPTGLDITSVEKIMIGTTEITDLVMTSNTVSDVTTYTIDFSKYIDASNSNSGKTITITYNAVVTSETGYTNTANSVTPDGSVGGDTVIGYTGDITLTKTDDTDDATPLAGAEFKVSMKGTDGTTDLYFVEVSDGVYRQATQEEIDDVDIATTQTVVTSKTLTEGEDNNYGTVKVMGLGDGTYFFTETKAPEGYSLNSTPTEDIVITPSTEGGNVSATISMVNTKLSSLPETGGIGTTIFTIGGCLIMLAAAAMFFASRRKEAK